MDADFKKIAEVCACFHLRRASRLVTASFDGELRPVGLTSTQFVVLVLLRLMGKIAMNDLSREMTVDQTTLTRLVIPLERRKLVKREGGDDKRKKFLSITSAGEKKLMTAVPHWKKAQTEIVDKFGERDWLNLKDKLKAL